MAKSPKEKRAMVGVSHLRGDFFCVFDDFIILLGTCANRILPTLYHRMRENCLLICKYFYLFSFFLKKTHIFIKETDGRECYDVAIQTIGRDPK